MVSRYALFWCFLVSPAKGLHCPEQVLSCNILHTPHSRMAEAPLSVSASGNKGARVTAVASVMIVLSVISVLFRFWSRLLAKKSGLWWDDWLALTALVCLITMLLDSSSHRAGVPSPSTWINHRLRLSRYGQAYRYSVHQGSRKP